MATDPISGVSDRNGVNLVGRSHLINEQRGDKEPANVWHKEGYKELVNIWHKELRLKLPTHLHIWSVIFNRFYLFLPNRSNICQCVGCYRSNLANQIAHLIFHHVGIPYPPADIIAKCVAGSGRDVTDFGPTNQSLWMLLAYLCNWKSISPDYLYCYKHLSLNLLIIIVS